MLSKPGPCRRRLPCRRPRRFRRPFRRSLPSIQRSSRGLPVRCLPSIRRFSRGQRVQSSPLIQRSSPGPTGPVFTFVPSFTMGPTGPVFTQVPAFTMGPDIRTTMDPGLGAATNFGLGPGAIATAPAGINLGGLASGGALRREESVTVLPGIGRDEQTRLTNAGIGNIGAVADADMTVLGTALGVQPAEAARVIGIARGALGRPS